MSRLVPLLVAFVVAVPLTIVVRGLARRFGLVVMPRHDRWHSTPTALYGGVAIAVATLVTATLVAGFSLFQHQAAAAVLASASMLFLVGLVDDARGLGPVSKLILQLAAATILIVAGVVHPLTAWTPVNVLVTLFWFVGIANAMNLLDNMDGVSAGVAAMAALGFAGLLLAAGDPILAAVALATAGAAGGFLVFNSKPASIFMGDGGSLFLGALLAGLGAAYPQASGIEGVRAVVVPVLILLVPILDTTLVTVTRTIHDRRISAGGRDHSTHRLVAMGFSEAGAALFLYGVSAAALVVAWAVVAMGPAAGLWLGLVFVTGALIFTGYLGRLHRYDDEPAEQRRRRGLIIRYILVRRRGLELLLDVVLFGVAYYGAFLLYYDAAIPDDMGALANGTLGLAIVLKLAAFHYFHVYRSVWYRPTLADIHRLIKAALLGSLLLLGTLFLVARGAGIPRVVFVLDLLLTGALATAARGSFGSLDRFRRRLRSREGEPVLIYGAGPETDLVLKVLHLRETNGLRPIGFVDDREDQGTLIHGLPVLGPSPRLETILATSGARHLVLASQCSEQEAGEVYTACRRLGVEVLSLDVSLRPLPEPLNGSRAGSLSGAVHVGGQVSSVAPRNGSHAPETPGRELSGVSQPR